MAVKITFQKENYVDEAEAVIKDFKQTSFKVGKNELTTSQIRNLLISTIPLYDAVRTRRSDSYDDLIAAVRINAVYQSGRNQAVKELVTSSGILDILDMINFEDDLKNKSEKILRFCKYMEAMVAYFEFYGGKD
ncbi:type III-A CRISPR-associated protein Csm2 [Limosilactobacillus fermentum]|uniref:type III-A CRISPR-associated protein Csm2 n=1 Tax=Limosilactobacillus fermentum TaxID=1613 RepID=UPI001075AC46|nr:type III-A CRISPR-associated protein Csm2 [Limosilactobacillus fermentum]TFZ15919.1 type III-A CRISPR-associated protein Csm2 [Limosilactobacillus fermentum]